MYMIGLAKKYCKTVQIEVKVYTERAGPKTERRKKKNLVFDDGDRRYNFKKKDSLHVD